MHLQQRICEQVVTCWTVTLVECLWWWSPFFQRTEMCNNAVSAVIPARGGTAQIPLWAFYVVVFQSIPDWSPTAQCGKWHHGMRWNSLWGLDLIDYLRHLLEHRLFDRKRNFLTPRSMGSVSLTDAQYLERSYVIANQLERHTRKYVSLRANVYISAQHCQICLIPFAHSRHILSNRQPVS